jgi:hypothetical protein
MIWEVNGGQIANTLDEFGSIEEICLQESFGKHACIQVHASKHEAKTQQQAHLEALFLDRLS